MSKKPASLTSDLLARKGEAEPSTIDPSARMTLSAGPGFSDEEYGGSRGGADDKGSLDDVRPLPPEPEIIYTAEETGSGGGSTRLIIVAVLGLIIVGGIFLAVTGNEPDNSVAPVSPDIVAQTAETPEPATPAAPADNAVPETLSATTSETPAPDAMRTTTPDTAPEAQAEAPAAETPAIEVPSAPVKAPEPAAEATPAAPAAVKPQSGGAYVVQLLALQDKAAARAAWAKISKKHANVLGGHALDIEEADLGAKGTWYRVRAAGFASKAAATSACSALKAAKQDCLVKKR
jgi:hypothetical protein